MTQTSVWVKRYKRFDTQGGGDASLRTSLVSHSPVPAFLLHSSVHTDIKHHRYWCTLHNQGSAVHKPYPTFSSTAPSSLNPVWCTGWKSADRGKVKCWGCFEFYRANINVKLALIVKYLFTVNKCIICKNFLFQTAIFLSQTCLDHGQTKPILVVLRLPSNPHGAEYECETLPQEERLFMTVAPQSGTYEAA